MNSPKFLEEAYPLATALAVRGQSDAAGATAEGEKSKGAETGDQAEDAVLDVRERGWDRYSRRANVVG